VPKSCLRQGDGRFEAGVWPLSFNRTYQDPITLSSPRCWWFGKLELVHEGKLGKNRNWDGGVRLSHQAGVIAGSKSSHAE